MKTSASLLKTPHIRSIKLLRASVLFLAAVLAGLVMYLFVLSCDREALLLAQPGQAAVFAAVLCFAAMLPLITERNTDAVTLLCGALAAAALIYVRVCLFYYRSGDYNSFLVHWVEDMRPLSFSQAVRSDIGNYNAPYEILLFLLSRTNWNSLYAIKALSCLFDILGAFYMSRLCSLYSPSVPLRTAAYLMTLALPTVWLNSSFWAQCDMVYAALCLGMLYHLLKKQGGAAVILWTLAFSFKLQAVFALPVLILGLFTRRIRLRHLAWAPAVFFAMLLPVLLGGQSLAACLQVYTDQAELYPQMHLNAPSVWVLLGHVAIEPFSRAAIFLTGAAVLLFLYLCWQLRTGLNERLFPMLFYACVLLVPFLLPHMHDRYFFLADLGSLLVFLQNRRRWPLPLITVLASYSCYRNFLMNEPAVVDIKWHAISLLAVLCWVLYTVFEEMRSSASAAVADPCKPAAEE